MKKITILLLSLLLVVGCNDNVSVSNSNSNTSNIDTSSNSNSNSTSNSLEDDEDVGKYKVHLYLFHSSTCEHCQEERKWLSSIKNDYPYLEIHYYEVTSDKNVYEKVKEQMGIDSNYVPLTIIGEDYYVGYSDSKGRKFIREIKELSKNDYCDVVGTIIEDGDVQACIDKNKGV